MVREAASASDHLLPLLRDAQHALEMALADWDDTLRLARTAGLLGQLGDRLHRCEAAWTALPEAVRGHFVGARHYAAHRARMVHLELDALTAALPAQLPVVLLKGAAYIAEGLPLARGRVPNDVDILVARADLDLAEASLLVAGWESETVDPYDQRYYREWSHELPPMRYPGHALEVDLHHTIAPVTSRNRVVDALLFSALRPLEGSRYLVLGGHDQILHAAIHLFQDSELEVRLRDLADIDGLLRHHLHDDADWAALWLRAERHGVSRLLWYALHYCHTWLATPVPLAMLQSGPPGGIRRFMDWLAHETLLPVLPDRRPAWSRRIAQRVAQLRYHLLRMPLGLLLRHTLVKTGRTLTGRFSRVAD